MLNLIVALFSISVVSALIDYRLSDKCHVNQTQKCRKSGLICESCSSLVACVNIDSKLVKIHIKSCLPHQSCINETCINDRFQRKCKSSQSLDCLPFVCTNPGIFPDPLDCKKYVLCVSSANGLKAVLNECEHGYGFNVATKRCDVKLAHCEGFPVPLCRKPGLTSPLEGDKSMFFICDEYSKKERVLYPFLSVCPHGLEYDCFNCFNSSRKLKTSRCPIRSFSKDEKVTYRSKKGPNPFVLLYFGR